MKIRSGFVSNSSSSSFILIYKDAKLSKITNEDIKSGKKYAFFSEGYEATQLNIISDVETLEYCKKKKSKNYELKEIFELGECIDSDDSISVNSLYEKHKDFKIMAVTLDHHMPDNLEDIKETLE